MESVKEEWKGMEGVDVKAITSKLDLANTSMCKWQAYKEEKETQRAVDEDSRYVTMANDIVAMVHALRIKKEANEPMMVLKAVQAFINFLKQALGVAEKCEMEIRTIGPVTPNPFHGFKMAPNVVMEGGTPRNSGVTSPYAAGAPSPYAPAPAQASPYGAPPPQSNPYGAPPPQSNAYGQPPAQTYQQPVQQAGPPPIPFANHAPAVPAPPARPQARALYPFTKTQPTELSFNTGDILFLNSTEGPWWQAELNGQAGLIPNNYVQRI